MSELDEAADASMEARHDWWEHSADGMSSSHYVVYGTKLSIAALVSMFDALREAIPEDVMMRSMELAAENQSLRAKLAAAEKERDDARAQTLADRQFQNRARVAEADRAAERERSEWLENIAREASAAAGEAVRSLKAWANPIKGMGSNISQEDRGRWQMAVRDYERVYAKLEAALKGGSDAV